MTQLLKKLPAFGFLIAVTLVGVTSAFKEAPKTVDGFVTYSFEYQPPSTDPYTIESVENPANWHYNPTPSQCNGIDKACSLEDVPASFVNPGSTPTLKPIINIDAVETSSNIAKVNSTDAPSAVINNQPN